MSIRRINDGKPQETELTVKSLFDHGGSHLIMQEQCVPPGTERFAQPVMEFKTAAGKMQSSSFIYLRDVRLPELNPHRKIKRVKCYIFDAPHVPHDAILGRSFLNPCGIDVKSSAMEVSWDDASIPFRTLDWYNNHSAMQKVLHVPPVRVEQAENHANHITETKSSFASIDDVIAEQMHLTEKQ